jgi:hypothetical protein
MYALSDDNIRLFRLHSGAVRSIDYKLKDAEGEVTLTYSLAVHSSKNPGLLYNRCPFFICLSPFTFSSRKSLSASSSHLSLGMRTSVFLISLNYQSGIQCFSIWGYYPHTQPPSSRTGGCLWSISYLVFSFF